MLPINVGGHAAYQELVVSQLREYYPDTDTIPESAWYIAEQFFLLDLSYVDELLKGAYSIFGPEPRLPSDMIRTYLVSLKFKVTSYTDWAMQLKLNPFYTIISGFVVGDTPGVGTFYDFNKRLWENDFKQLNPHEKFKKTKAKPPNKNGTKAESTEKETVESLLESYQRDELQIEIPFSRLYDVFQHSFLRQSVQRNLIDMDSLKIAGDGMPVVTSARERKKRICNCIDDNIYNCQCKRYFSQPDCDVGWDSSRECFYHGYDCYTLTAPCSDNDLPIFALLHPASRHDSIGFIHTWFAMKHVLSDTSVNKLLLDAAHDAMPIYEYCRDKRITPFIDLNEKRGIKVKYKDDFTVGEDGIPVCKAGLKMKPDGVEYKKYRAKFRCPKYNQQHGCRCNDPCSDKPKRTVHLALKDNPRIFNIPPRNSEKWKTEYNARTSAERNNKRQKIDYKLEDGKHRSTREWYCRLYSIMMLQHLDAWDLPFTSTIRTRIAQAA